MIVSPSGFFVLLSSNLAGRSSWRKQLNKKLGTIPGFGTVMEHIQ
jgi:hypothetical protein